MSPCAFHDEHSHVRGHFLEVLQARRGVSDHTTRLARSTIRVTAYRRPVRRSRTRLLTAATTAATPGLQREQETLRTDCRVRVGARQQYRAITATPRRRETPMRALTAMAACTPCTFYCHLSAR